MSSDQRVAIVTGANRGTGRAIADALAARGYRVCELNRTFAGGVEADEWLCDLVVGEIEIRPACLPEPPVTGLDRLQHV